MSSAQHHWDTIYASRSLVSTIDYAQYVASHIKPSSHPSLLDIGCGDGRDSLFFAQQGFSVTAVDFSEIAIAKLLKQSSAITTFVQDIRTIDFPEQSFDVVYAHLSLHYFDDQTTDAIFQTIYRILRKDGLFFIRCKSIHDPFYGQGTKIGKDMFFLEHERHFFSCEYMREKLHHFDVLSLQETSSSYDQKKSFFIEAIARK